MTISTQVSGKFIQDLKAGLAVAQNSDWTFAFKILEYLSANPGKVSEFGKNPEEFVRNNGMTLPDGYHLHYIDADGTRYPPEPDLKGPWIRYVVEISDGQHLLGTCGICIPIIGC